MSWLDELKEGDKVINQYGVNTTRVLRVKRSTKTQIVCSLKNPLNEDYEIKFNKRTGYIVGGGHWSRSYIVEATEETIEAVRKKIKDKKLKEWASAVKDFDVETIEKLKEFHDELFKQLT